MAEFVLCNNYFQFSEFFQQISGTAISTKFAPPYTCIYMQTWIGKASIALAHVWDIAHSCDISLVWYIARLKLVLCFILFLHS